MAKPMQTYHQYQASKNKSLSKIKERIAFAEELHASPDIATFMQQSQAKRGWSIIGEVYSFMADYAAYIKKEAPHLNHTAAAIGDYCTQTFLATARHSVDGLKNASPIMNEGAQVDLRVLGALNTDQFVQAFTALQRLLTEIYDDILQDPFRWGYPNYYATGGYYNRINDILYALCWCGTVENDTLTVDAQKFFTTTVVKRHKKLERIISGLENFGLIFDGFIKSAESFTVALPKTKNVITALKQYVTHITENHPKQIDMSPISSYLVAAPEVKKPVARKATKKFDIEWYADSLPPNIVDWMRKACKILDNAPCRVSGDWGRLVYTSRHTKKTVCIISYSREWRFQVNVQGYHFLLPTPGTKNILDLYPAATLPFLQKSCGCRGEDHRIKSGASCVHGICGVFRHGDTVFQKCLYHGYYFNYGENDFEESRTDVHAALTLQGEKCSDMLLRWLELEANFNGKVEIRQQKIGQVPDITYEEIEIAPEFLNGRDPTRAKNALWSAYNALKKMRDNTSHISAFGEMYRLMENATLTDDNTLVCVPNYRPDEYVMGEKYQYLPAKYGFQYSNYVYHDGTIDPAPKKKPNFKNVTQFEISYIADDFDDVMYGLKFFADICAIKPWPYFMEADVRVAARL